MDVLDTFRMPCKLFLVRCRDQDGCLPWETGDPGGGLGGAGAVPALSCHPWHKQPVPGLWSRLCRGLRAPPASGVTVWRFPAGLRALCGSCGAKHSAGVPEVGLSPASPPGLDSTCIPSSPSTLTCRLSALSWHHRLDPSPGKNPRPKLLIAAASLLPDPGLISEGSKESDARCLGCEQSWAWLTAASSASVNSKASGAVGGDPGLQPPPLPRQGRA